MDGRQYTSTRIVSNAVTAQRRSPQVRTGEELDKSHINQLFGVMRLNYPSFLNDTSNEDIASTKKMWWSYLKDYDQAVMNKATSEVVHKFKKFAPTLGEFKELLDEIKREPAHRPTRDTRMCDVCRSYAFTRHHHEVCVTGKRSLYEVTEEQIEETKAMFAQLR